MASTLASQRSDNSVRQKRSLKTETENATSDKNNNNNNAVKMSMKTFEPARKKLTSVESQRLVNSLDECVEKLEISTLIPEVVLSDLDRFHTMLGEYELDIDFLPCFGCRLLTMLD